MVTRRVTNIAWLLAPRLVTQLLTPGGEAAQTHRLSTVGRPEEATDTKALGLSEGNGKYTSCSDWPLAFLWHAYNPRTHFKYQEAALTRTEPSEWKAAPPKKAKRGRWGRGGFTQLRQKVCLSKK